MKRKIVTEKKPEKPGRIAREIILVETIVITLFNDYELHIFFIAFWGQSGEHSGIFSCNFL